MVNITAEIEERSKQRKFIRDIEMVSTSLAAWVQNCFNNGWSLDDVKVHLRAVMKFVEKDKE